MLIAEKMIDQDQGDHGFGHGHGAGRDAGIVTAFHPDFGLFAFLRNGVLLAVDGGSGFDDHPHHDLVAIGDAAENTTGIIGLVGNLFSFGDKNVVALQAFVCA